MLKRGVSPVVATMLLLVITVLLAALIMTFVVPFVQDSLGDSKECLQVLDGIEFAESEFNCFSSDETGFSVKVKKEKVSGFKISLIDNEDNADAIEVTEGVSGGNAIRMKGIINYNTDLEVASSGGQRTYVASEVYSKAEIAPLGETGKVCEVADIIEFTPCANGVSLT